MAWRKTQSYTSRDVGDYILTEDEKVLLIVKDDIDNLVHRLNAHFEDYIRVFTQKRTRDHFKDVFFSRFKDISVSDLVKLSGEVLIEVNNFYYSINELYWYLKVTEDMPAMVENKIKSELMKVNDIASRINELIIGDNGSSREDLLSEEVGTDDIFDEEVQFKIEKENLDTMDLDDQVDDELDLPPPFEDDIGR